MCYDCAGQDINNSHSLQSSTGGLPLGLLLARLISKEKYGSPCLPYLIQETLPHDPTVAYHAGYHLAHYSPTQNSFIANKIVPTIAYDSKKIQQVFKEFIK